MIDTITLGMGCFWSPEALFGHLPGVLRTRVGYAGGTTPHPTYRELGDHSEVLEVDFDSSIITLDALVEVFWDHHNPINVNNYKGRQYHSLLFYRDIHQQAAIRTVLEKRSREGKGEPETEINPYTQFVLAEERHQKYYLKRYPDAIVKLSVLYPSATELMNATIAARLNGLAKGYTNRERIMNEVVNWPKPLEEREKLLGLVKQIRW